MAITWLVYKGSRKINGVVVPLAQLLCYTGGVESHRCPYRVRLATSDLTHVAVGTNQPLPKLLTSFLTHTNHYSWL
jgi:hypothetical protein